MKLKKINKILKDPTTSKRLKKEIHFLFEELEILNHRYENLLFRHQPVGSTEELLKKFIKDDWIPNKLKESFISFHSNLEKNKSVESTEDLFTQPKPGETPETITASTLKAPSEWLKLMSEEERKQWEENIIKSNEMLTLQKNMTFYDFIAESFDWNKSPQRHTYWSEIANRYENK